jgi:hypothetical protein
MGILPAKQAGRLPLGRWRRRERKSSTKIWWEVFQCAPDVLRLRSFRSSRLERVVSSHPVDAQIYDATVG